MTDYNDPQTVIKFFARWHQMSPQARIETAREYERRLILAGQEISQLQRERDIAKAEAASLRLILDRVQRQCPTATLSAPIEILG